MSYARAAATNAARAFTEIPGPMLYPIVGNLHQYVFGPFNKFKYHEALAQLHKEYGPLVKENIGGRVIVHVFDTEDIKTVYSHEGKWPVIPPLQETTQMYRAQKQMSLGLGNTNGEEWYRLRTNSQQKMLRPKEVQHHLPSVNAIAKDFATRIEAVKYGVNNEVNDLRMEVGKWSLENAGSLVFDRRLGCLDLEGEGEKFSTLMVEANAKIFKLSGILKLSLPFYKYISTPKWRQLVEAEDEFYSRAIQLVDEAVLRLRDAIESGSMNSKDFYFLSYLLSKTDISLKDVTVICLSLFADGLSTTTPTVLFNLYALATNQEVQSKVHDEISAVMKGVAANDDINQEHINQMPYLKAFVRETFRLWPNGTEVSRYTETDMVLSGYQVPAGTHVDLNPLVHFRDGKLFPDPHVYRPERWLRKGEEEDGENNSVHPYLLTPFGHGTRMCAGRRFAEQDLYVLLATILRKYKLEYPVGEGMAQIYNTLLFPDRPVRVKFVSRK